MPPPSQSGASRRCAPQARSAGRLGLHLATDLAELVKTQGELTRSFDLKLISHTRQDLKRSHPLPLPLDGSP